MRTFSKTKFLRTSTLNFFTLGLVVLLAVFYILVVNGSMGNGYRMRELETKIKSLSLEQQQLEGAVRQAQSLESISRSVKMMGFTRAESITYIQGSAPAFALAE